MPPSALRPALLRAAFAAVLAASLPAAQEPAQTAGPRSSLEDFLERARAARAALHARLEPIVRGAFSAPGAGETQLDALVELGPEATPLLVGYLDPGPEPDVEAERDAELAVRALASMEPIPIRARLLELLADGSPPARVRAARVLSALPADETVQAALRLAYDEGSPELKRASLEALLALDGPDTDALLEGALRSSEPSLVEAALAAARERRTAGPAPAIRELLASARGLGHVASIAAYYRAQPELADDEVLEGFTRLATGTASSEVKLKVLAALPALGPRLSSLRRRLEPLTESRDRDLREAALCVLASLGDRGARRDLLEPYDDLVDRNERWSQAYSRRADVLRRIGDHDGAVRDYKRAIEYSKDDPKPDRALPVSLARSLSLSGKLREAAEWLRRAPISLEELRALADDPDFAALRDSRFAAEAFSLEDER